MVIRLIYAAVLIFAEFGNSIELDINSKDSVCSATDIIQKSILRYYLGNRPAGRVGMFEPPYYWWEAGEVFGGMLENWYLCDNKEHEDTLRTAMVSQIGANKDYMPSDQWMSEGNDDHGIWGILVMDAAERNFSDSKENGVPGWLELSQAVFNKMWARWDTQSCGGGLRWQIFEMNIGYNYKNTISNGCLFHLAARLARYTSQSSYADVAETVFDWLVGVNFITFSEYARVRDGASIDQNCTNIDAKEWSYNSGIILAGCAYMYNYTNGSSKWEDRLNKVLDRSLSIFFKNDIMYESACQDYKTCDTDQRSFKSIYSRMLALTSVIAPYTQDRIMKNLRASALAAARTCVGGNSGVSCAMNWHNSFHDGITGLGEEASALEVIQSVLINSKPPPLTANSGGESKGNVDAGKFDNSTTFLKVPNNTTNKDRIGASITTAIMLAVILATALWMIL